MTSLHQFIHKSRSPSRKTSALTISKAGSTFCWFAIEGIEAARVLLYGSFRSSIHESAITTTCILADIERTCLLERTCK